MPNLAQKVPYGYEPPEERTKGTLVFYDSFEKVASEELDRAANLAEKRSFSKLVLYLVHEETMKRMSKEPVQAYHKREKKLDAWLEEREENWISVDGWEGKRKKYTPIDHALRHLTETLPAPYFLLLTPEMANSFASFSSFGDWIGRLRLILTEMPERLHPELRKHRERWDLAEDKD